MATRAGKEQAIMEVKTASSHLVCVDAEQEVQEEHLVKEEDNVVKVVGKK